jgi:hypothetical protein
VAIAIGCIHIGTITGKLNGACAHAERLAERVRVDVGRDLLGVLPFEQLRDAAGELHHLHAADDLTLGVGEHLAVLVRDDLGQLVEVALDELAEREHDAGPADERHVAPALERLPRRRDGRVDIRRLGEHDLGLHLTAGGIPHLRAPNGRAGGLGAADPVLDRLHVSP